MEVGSIVTVRKPGTIFDGKQGQVMGQELQTGEFLVKFGPIHNYVVGHCDKEEDGYVAFAEAELIVDNEWLPENRAILTFGNSNWFRITTITEPFVLGQICDHQGCQNKATRRIMVNVHGTIVEEDVCDKHAKQYHGKLIDGPFPNKSPQERVAEGGLQ